VRSKKVNISQLIRNYELITLELHNSYDEEKVRIVRCNAK